MTDARVSQAAAQVLNQPVPQALVSSATLQVLNQPVSQALVSRAAVQVLSGGVASGPRPYVRTVGSSAAVKMKQSDGSWWPVQVAT